MKKTILFIVIILTVSCSKNYLFKRDQIKISKELKDIKTSDQAVRKFSHAVDVKYGIRTASTVWDSLIIRDLDIHSVNVSTLPSIKDQIKKHPESYQKAYYEEQKASEDLMFYVDSLHLEQIYRITKIYGYPSYDTRPWANDSIKVGCGFVLTHFYYGNEKAKRLLKLLIKEYKHKRLNDSDMAYLIWHVNGRQGTELKDIDIDKWIKDYQLKN